MIGSILFVRSSSPISWIIRKLTKSNFSHVAISIVEDNSVVIDADAFRSVKVKKNDYDFFEVADIDLSLEQRNLLLDFLFKQVGSRYDYLQTIGLAIRLLGLKTKHNLWDSPNRLECIELVDKAYLSIGVDLMPEIPNGDATPSDLANILL